MIGKFLNSPAGSWFKAAIASVLAAIFIKLKNKEALFTIDALQDLATVFATAIIPVLINFLNPQDTRYGKGAD
jgi:hypothetical protein